jgi:carboxypeptidase Taq
MSTFDPKRTWRSHLSMSAFGGSGYIGGRFQSYAIGNILAAQFYAAALKVHTEIPRQIASGEFRTLHAWLRDNL